MNATVHTRTSPMPHHSKKNINRSLSELSFNISNQSLSHFSSLCLSMCLCVITVGAQCALRKENYKMVD